MAVRDITQVGANTKSARTAAGTLNAAVPAGIQEGDLLIMCCIVASANNVPATPAGLTVILTQTTAPSLAIFYRICNGTESGTTFPFVFTGSGGCVHTRAYRNASLVNAIHKSSSNRVTSTSNATATGVTPTIDGCKLLFFAGSVTVTATAFTNPTGFSNQDLYSNSGAGSTVSCDMTQATAAATGNLTGTWTGITGNTWSVLLALAPSTKWARASGVQETTPDLYYWTCPSGVFSLDVEAWAAGGGSGGGFATDNLGGSGAGGGEYRKFSYQVVPGTTYLLLVGKGGYAGLTAAAGAKGLDSWFRDNGTDMLRAKGGGGGGGDGGPAGTGGDAGTGGTTHYKGGDGAQSTNTNGAGGGSSAGTAANGNNASGATGGSAPTGGSAGGNGSATGNVGVSPGSGAGGPNSATSPAGKDGGPGAIKITWVESYPRAMSLQLM